ncbi:DNA-binding protein [Vibrio sp. 10N.237.312.C02]
MWVDVSQLLNRPGMAGTPQGVRYKLNQLGVVRKRKRQGSKAFEYHLDCLPEETRLHLLRDVAKQQTLQAEDSRHVRQVVTPDSDEL